MATAKSFKRLHDLGPEIVAQVDQMLLSGATPTAVARWLQIDKKLLPDLKESSVKKNLERYRSNDIREKVLSDLADQAQGKSISGVHKKLVTMDELEHLAMVQKGRVGKLLLHEAKLPPGIMLKQASEEIRLLKDTLVELGRLQLETGIIKRAAKTGIGSVTDPETGATRNFTWTEAQADLMAQLESMPIEGEYEEVDVPDASR